jgi:hypothetical protein
MRGNGAGWGEKKEEKILAEGILLSPGVLSLVHVHDLMPWFFFF